MFKQENTLTMHCIIAFSGASGIVRPSSGLDYESMADKSYILNISATDYGHPQFTSYATLNITVTDFNDNQPKFSQNSFSLGVSEDTAVDIYFDQITATDEDTGENAKVTVSIHLFNYLFNYLLFVCFLILMITEALILCLLRVSSNMI